MGLIWNYVESKFCGIPTWGKHEKKLWHRILIQKPYDLREQWIDVKLWFFYRFHPAHKYNKIDTRLPPKFYEVNTRMLYGMFSLLCEHVENIRRAEIEATISELREMGAEKASHYGSTKLETYEEILALHDWWTRDRVADIAFRKELSRKIHRSKPFEPTPDPDDPTVMLTKKPARTKLRELQERAEAEEMEMMHRLVAVQPFLWN